tara:strand:- start:332 stop:967 length:636 start_codon:yes stop_codon:yes gene_type:complete
MAIADGMAINCSDLQAVGGTRTIAIREWATTDVVVYNDTTHGITSIKENVSSGNWGVYESRIESSSLTVTGSNEGKDTTTYECTLSWFIPGLTAAQFKSVYDFDGSDGLGGKCLMVMVIDNNDMTSGTTEASSDQLHNKVIGVSKRYENEGSKSRNQTYARLVSVEGGTGAAFSDEIGITVTIAATQYEIPRQYLGTIILGSGGLTLTTSS